MRPASLWGAWIALLVALGGCTGSVVKGLPLRADGGDAGFDLTDGGIGTDPTTVGGRPTDAGTNADDDDFGPDDDRDGGGGSSRGNDRNLSTDRGAFFGAARCDRLSARLCDDFESESAGARPDGTLWRAPYGYYPEVDATRAARGQKSLHFHLSGSTPGHIEEVQTFPAARNTLFGRMFVWFDVLPSAPSSAQWSVVVATSMDEQAEVRVGGQPASENRLGVGSRRPGEGGWDWHTAGTDAQSRPRTGAWICLEWQFKGDTNETRVWVDGVEQGSLHLTETEFRRGDEEGGQRFRQPTFARLRVGWWLYPTESPQPSEYDVWIDELAVDDTRIGCVD